MIPVTLIATFKDEGFTTLANAIHSVVITEVVDEAQLINPLSPIALVAGFRTDSGELSWTNRCNMYLPNGKALSMSNKFIADLLDVCFLMLDFDGAQHRIQ